MARYIEELVMQTNTNITLRREGALGYQPARLVRGAARRGVAPSGECQVVDLFVYAGTTCSTTCSTTWRKREECLEHPGHLELGQRLPNWNVIGFGPFAFGPSGASVGLTSDSLIGASDEAMDRAAEKGPT